MQKKKNVLKRIFVISLLSCLLFSSINVSAASIVLKKGSRGNSVTQLQKDLKTLGFFSASNTGYYGTITTSAVKKLQKKYGLTQDGIAGKVTFSTIDRLLGRTADRNVVVAAKTATTKIAVSNISRGSMNRDGYLIPWFEQVENIFVRGGTARVLDIETGLSFNIMRTYGRNHADCETLTAEDTAVMKKIYGGQWSWSRRPIIVTVDNNVRIAASMAGMPHAGLDNQPKNIYINSRSGGYGYGQNLDTIKDNNMNGHFDIHFLGSRTHSSNIVESNHQNAVKKAAEWAKKAF